MHEVSIAFADDHPLLLEGLAASFRRKPGFRLEGLGASFDEALSIVETRRPDVLVMDLNMPGDMLATTRDILARFPETRIVVFTASEDTGAAIAALNAGVLGYVLKGSSVNDVILAIRAALQGDTFITPSFASRVIGALQLKPKDTRKIATSQLSVREEQIVKKLLLGKRNREIASDLNLSERTVKSYMTGLMQKLRARNRLEVVIVVKQMNEDEANRPTSGGPPS